MNAITLNMTTTASDDAGSNTAPFKDALMKEIHKLGAAEAMGGAARPIAAKKLVSSAFDGLLVEGDAEPCYARYRAGYVSVGSKTNLTANEPTERVQVSKFRQFIKVGMLPGIDARDVMDRAEAALVAARGAGDKTHSPFDALLNVAREQMKQPDLALSDEQIAAIVAKPEPREKELIEKIVAAYKTSHKLNNDTGGTIPGLEQSVQGLADAIREAGGEVPPVTKEEKARSAFVKQAQAFGYQI